LNIIDLIYLNDVKCYEMMF